MRLIPRADGHGRVPAVEVMIATPFIRDCIINKDKTKLIHEAIAAGVSQYGMQTFDQSIFQLYKKELITLRRGAAPREQPGRVQAQDPGHPVHLRHGRRGDGADDAVLRPGEVAEAMPRSATGAPAPERLSAGTAAARPPRSLGRRSCAARCAARGHDAGARSRRRSSGCDASATWTTRASPSASRAAASRTRATGARSSARGSSGAAWGASETEAGLAGALREVDEKAVLDSAGAPLLASARECRAAHAGCRGCGRSCCGVASPRASCAQRLSALWPRWADALEGLEPAEPGDIGRPSTETRRDARGDRVKTADEIRSGFLRYFEERGHRVVTSSSLVPQNDPTLLFANAGMNQFKDVFLGREKRDYARAASSQKCVRAGGKHNDLENVGVTARHHTFFEMLGNFSFGDYFKQDAIAFAWEFLTRELGLPVDRLKVTIFKGDGAVPRDDEAHGFWTAHVAGGPHPRARAEGQLLGHGRHRSLRSVLRDPLLPGRRAALRREAAGGACLGVECECDRWLEIWNLVFMQYDRDAHGTLQPAARALRRHRDGPRAHRRGRAGQALQLRHRPLHARCSTRSARRAGTQLRRRGGRRRLAARRRRPPARDDLPDRRRRPARQRGPRLRAAQDHAPRDAPRHASSASRTPS